MWLHAFLMRLMGPPKAEVTRDMAWLERIPPAAAPPEVSSLFGSHVATNKAECPFTHLADRRLPDTVRLDHGVLRGSIPDAVYTRDPGLARQILQNKAHPKVHRWYQFHRRLYGYRLPAELMSVSSADDPMVARLRKVYIAALAEALERHGPEMAAHIDRWIDRVARGPVNVATAIRRLNAELSHLLAFGKLPADPMYVLAYTYIEFTLRDSKRRLAHLLWPPLDRLPTPYGLASWTRGAVTKGSAAIYYWRQRHKTDSFLGRMRELGAAEGDPDFVFRTMPLFVDAVNALLPHPMMMSLIELAAKPDVQQRVVDEDLFAEAIKETLRLHPPLTTIARVTTDRVESESAVLERMASSEGQVYINSTAIHRDPRGWPRPDDFIVDRWLPGWSDGGDPDRRLYIPFGLGARSCVAASFASKILEGFLRQVLTRRIVSNPSGRAPRIAQGSQAFVRRPFVLQFEDRPARSGRA